LNVLDEAWTFGDDSVQKTEVSPVDTWREGVRSGSSGRAGGSGFALLFQHTKRRQVWFAEFRGFEFRRQRPEGNIHGVLGNGPVLLSDHSAKPGKEAAPGVAGVCLARRN
jgi:hypothetical protein